METLPAGLYVRFRMDGMLHQPELGALQEACDRNARNHLARQDLGGSTSPSAPPQDGSFRVQIERDGKVRPNRPAHNSIVPRGYDESVVLSVLDQASVPS